MCVSARCGRRHSAKPTGFAGEHPSRYGFLRRDARRSFGDGVRRRASVYARPLPFHSGTIYVVRTGNRTLQLMRSPGVRLLVASTSKRRSGAMSAVR